MEKSNCPMPLEDIKERVLCAIVDLYRCDGDLLDRDANERSITHKLAEHLQRQFPEWNVDCEYNRQREAVKRLSGLYRKGEISDSDLEAKTVFPDIIVHKRGTRDNFIIIEVKKLSRSSNCRKDIKKLKAFTQHPEFMYCMGLFLIIGTLDEAAKLAVYCEGKKKHDWAKDLKEKLENLEVSECEG